MRLAGIKRPASSDSLYEDVRAGDLVGIVDQRDSSICAAGTFVQRAGGECQSQKEFVSPGAMIGEQLLRRGLPLLVYFGNQKWTQSLKHGCSVVEKHVTALTDGQEILMGDFVNCPIDEFDGERCEWLSVEQITQAREIGIHSLRQ
ncbi:MAG: hypothetical protein EXS37_13395 [Opitutus sp.]|nr:hypothetical protein [Opitutus sp.]